MNDQDQDQKWSWTIGNPWYLERLIYNYCYGEEDNVEEWEKDRYKNIDMEYFTFLLTHTDVNHQKEINGFTSLTLVCMVRDYNRPTKPYDLIKFLLDSGADPNLKTKRGQTALFGALGSGVKSHVQLILESGGDPYAVDEDGDDYKEYTTNQELRELVESYMKN